MSELSYDAPVCPYCETMDTDWWEGLPPKDDGDRWMVECPFCGCKYAVQLSISWIFESSRETPPCEPAPAATEDATFPDESPA